MHKVAYHYKCNTNGVLKGENIEESVTKENILA